MPQPLLYSVHIGNWNPTKMPKLKGIKNRCSPDIYDINSIVKYRNRDFRIVNYLNSMRIRRTSFQHFDRPVLTFYCFFHSFLSSTHAQFVCVALCPFSFLHCLFDFIYPFWPHQQKFHHIGLKLMTARAKLHNQFTATNQKFTLSIVRLLCHCQIDWSHIHHADIIRHRSEKKRIDDQTEFHQQQFLHRIDLPVVDNMLSHPFVQ